jgi:uncharacterized protein (TIGR02646 family)
VIRLEKLEPPAILIEKAAEWRVEYVAASETGAWPSEAAKTRYRHPEIKKVIQRETADKCAYCESKITQVHPGDCEHILPKSQRPDLVVDWENLTLACNECNRRKQDYYEPGAPLINPYKDQPDSHLRWYGPMALAASEDGKGRVTVRLLELSRLKLVERRTERIHGVRNLIELWESTEDAAYKNVLWGEIVRQASSDREYSACAREFILQHLRLANLIEAVKPTGVE